MSGGGVARGGEGRSRIESGERGRERERGVEGDDGKRRGEGGERRGERGEGRGRGEGGEGRGERGWKEERGGGKVDEGGGRTVAPLCRSVDLLTRTASLSPSPYPSSGTSIAPDTSCRLQWWLRRQLLKASGE